MSKRETPLTHWYWRQTGGLLIEEFPLVAKGADNSPRRADGLIVLGEPNEISAQKDFDVEGRDVIVVQTKARRLGMNLMGQCLFSLALVKQLRPTSAMSVALCTQDDAILRPLLEIHPGCQVVVCPEGIAL